MKIHNECTFLKPDGIAKMENMYKRSEEHTSELQSH